MSGGGEGEGGGKLPSVDHGRRTDEGRDKKTSTKDLRVQITDYTELSPNSILRSGILIC